MTDPVPVYRVEFTAQAKRDLQALQKRPPDGNVLSRVNRAIKDLSTIPRPPGSIKLTNEGDIRRIVVGDYRILYEVDDRRHVVAVARIRHRREAYRDE